MTQKTEAKELVSIVVPVYNVERYLGSCLHSLISQTYEEIEILLIDDGSADRSGSICDEYAGKDQRIKVCHRENGGVSAARNSGIKAARGKYLIFVDSDDCIHPRLIEFYMKHKEAGRVLLCDTVSDMDAWRQDLKEAALETTDYKKFMRLFYEDYINPPFNKLYETEMIRENQIWFPEGNDLGEDLLFNLEYFRHAPKDYGILHAQLYCYRENREGSLSTSYRKDLFEIQQESFGALKQFLEDTGVWDEENSRIYYGIYWDRLYLTVRMCRAYEKEHPGEHRLKEILRSPLWHEVWEACERRKLINWKRRIKAALLQMYRLQR